jgi:hypothetical protein
VVEAVTVIVGPGWVTVTLCVSVAWIVYVMVSSDTVELDVVSVGWVEVVGVDVVSTSGAAEVVRATVDVKKAAVAPSET